MCSTRFWFNSFTAFYCCFSTFKIFTYFSPFHARRNCEVLYLPEACQSCQEILHWPSVFSEAWGGVGVSEEILVRNEGSPKRTWSWSGHINTAPTPPYPTPPWCGGQALVIRLEKTWSRDGAIMVGGWANLPSMEERFRASLGRFPSWLRWEIG